MKLLTIAALASFIAIGAAQPLENGRRAIVTRTVTTEVVEIEYEYETVYVTPGQVVATSTQVNVAGHQKDGYKHQDFHKRSSTTTTSTSTLAPVEAPTSTPAPVQTPTSTPAPAQEPTPVKEPAPVQTPTFTPAPVQEPAPTQSPTSTPAPTQQPAPVQEPTTSAAPLVPSSTPAAPAAPATSAAPAAPVASPVSNSYDSGSSTADCGKIGAHCSGRISFYDITKAPGVYNACGWQSDGLTEDIVAIAAGET